MNLVKKIVEYIQHLPVDSNVHYFNKMFILVIMGFDQVISLKQQVGYI